MTRQGDSLNRRPGCGVAAFVVAGLLVLAAVLVWFQPLRSDRDRVQGEHSITLPPSASEIQAMGDASNPLLLAVGLDRGASTIFVLDRAELPDLLDEFGVVGAEAAPANAENMMTCFGGANGPAPGNPVYQPNSVPWPPDAQPEQRLSTDSPPGSGDISCIYVYGLDDDTIGVWMYTDWN